MIGPRPLIGVTTSEIRPAPSARPVRQGDPPQTEMALGMPYLRGIEAAGGLPLVIPPLAQEAIEPLLRDAVLAAGRDQIIATVEDLLP